MITQEKMYDIFFNNQEFVKFVNSTHFKKAVPNEKVYKAMLSNKVYATFLCSQNKQLNKKEITKSLDLFNNYFWLKKEPLCLIIFLKYVKKDLIKVASVYNYFTHKALISAVFSYLNILLMHTKINDKIISDINEILDENPVEALNIILKKNLIK